MVGHIVRESLSRLPGHVNRGDLMSAGFKALTLAADNWEAERGVPLPRDAAIRIRAPVTDELRALDWASRGVRSRARAIADARTALVGSLGRTPTGEELQAATGMSRAELEASARDTAKASALSPHTAEGEAGAGVLTSSAPDPLSTLVQREAMGYLEDAVVELPDRLRRVVRGYFLEQRPMADLAAELGVTDSRISQLRSEAVRLLRAALHEPSHGTPDASRSTTGPRAVATRDAYMASVATRSSLAERLRRTSALSGPHPYVALDPAS